MDKRCGTCGKHQHTCNGSLYWRKFIMPNKVACPHWQFKDEHDLYLQAMLEEIDKQAKIFEEYLSEPKAGKDTQKCGTCGNNKEINPPMLPLRYDPCADCKDGSEFEPGSEAFRARSGVIRRGRKQH